jgi:hypothetical protein
LLLLPVGAPDAPEVERTFPDRNLHCENGRILIRSAAPLETIQARSLNLRGIVDPETQAFAWSVDIKTLDGFNGPLQREHFNENYMESDRYPKASFTGKIIEKIDFKKDGSYAVRAKGKFKVHGVEQERIIKTRIDIRNGRVSIHSVFNLVLAEHDILIPRIVCQKIAEDVEIRVDADLKPGA